MIIEKQNIIILANKIFEDLLNQKITIACYELDGAKGTINKSQLNKNDKSLRYSVGNYTIECWYCETIIISETIFKPNVGVIVREDNDTIIYSRKALVTIL